MFSGRTRIRLLVVTWLLLVGSAVAVGVSAEQNDLGTKAEEALASAGIDAAVEVSGRDVTVTGSADDKERVEELVGAIYGVRVVNFADGSESAATPDTTTSAAQAPPSTTPTAAASSTLPPISDDAPGNVSLLEARLEGGRLTLRGTIPDAEAAARLEAVADLIYSPLMTHFLDDLDASGNALAYLTLPPIPGFSGFTLCFAYCLYNPYDFVSNPWMIDILP